jgi:hypothetical protein
LGGKQNNVFIEILGMTQPKALMFDYYEWVAIKNL